MRKRGPVVAFICALAAAVLILPASAMAINPVSFSEVGHLTTPRDYPGAALLPDGRVLVAGGWDRTDYVKTAEVFDPKTNSFSPLAATMNSIRYAPATADLPDGRVLFAGGNDGSDDLATAEVFNPNAGTFSPVGSLSRPRQGATAASLPDGRVLVAGGYDHGTYLDSSDIFDPKTNTFSPGPNLPGGATYGAAAAAISGGQILVAGGYRNPGGVYLDTAALFNGSAFTATTSLPTHTYGAAGASLPQGRALLAGGYDDNIVDGYLTRSLIFDPNSSTFSSAGIGNLNHRREEAAAVELEDGRVLVAGGYDSDALDTAEVLSVPSNSFTSKLKGRKVKFSVTNEGVAQVSDTSVKVATTAKKKKKPKLVKTTSKHGGPGTIVVKIKLTKQGSAKLRQKGKLSVRVAYTPDQGLAATRKLKLRAGK
jgi:Galactose oxidase, central domain/Kelch motif